MGVYVGESGCVETNNAISSNGVCANPYHGKKGLVCLEEIAGDEDEKQGRKQGFHLQF